MEKGNYRSPRSLRAAHAKIANMQNGPSEKMLAIAQKLAEGPYLDWFISYHYQITFLLDFLLFLEAFLLAFLDFLEAFLDLFLPPFCSVPFMDFLERFLEAFLEQSRNVYYRCTV